MKDFHCHSVSGEGLVGDVHSAQIWWHNKSTSTSIGTIQIYLYPQEEKQIFFPDFVLESVFRKAKWEPKCPIYSFENREILGEISFHSVPLAMPVHA